MRWLFLLGLIVSASFAPAQTAAEISGEPHHRLLLENSEVRVFALTLAPREQAYVRHTHNFLFVPLQDGELVLWSAGTSAVQHFLFRRGQVHFWLGERVGGMRNDGSASFRAVIVEFLNPKVTSYGYQYQSGTWDYGSGAINAPVDPDAKFIDEMTVGAASVADVQLLTADTYPPPKKEADELLIAVTELDLKANDDTLIHKASGDVLWIPAGRTWPLTNVAGTAARFAVVALWKASN